MYSAMLDEPTKPTAWTRGSVRRDRSPSDECIFIQTDRAANNLFRHLLSRLLAQFLRGFIFQTFYNSSFRVLLLEARLIF
jgi:hypothetical protein